MADHQASRTLVKSAPELWAECSDARSLARHLDGFGEIRITRLEPETAVAWEGEHASGTVKLEPSGWGTKVTMTIDSDLPAPPEDSRGRSARADPGDTAPRGRTAPRGHTAPSPPSTPPAPEWRGGLMSRLVAHLWRRPAAGLAELTVLAEVTELSTGGASAEAEAAGSEAEAAGAEAEAARAEAGEVSGPSQSGAPASPAPAALTSALESLGAAHRRPFSRG